MPDPFHPTAPRGRGSWGRLHLMYKESRDGGGACHLPESDQRGSRAQPPGRVGLPRGHVPPLARKECSESLPGWQAALLREGPGGGIIPFTVPTPAPHHCSQTTDLEKKSEEGALSCTPDGMPVPLPSPLNPTQ